jgi:hypothetical protein
MKTAFLTEMGWHGKVPADHPNMRTEMAWMYALQADHFNIHEYEQIKEYDVVFIIFPKATVKLSAIGIEMATPGVDKDISIYTKPVVETLKKSNGKVCTVQEGPSWFFNEYDMPTQFNFYNQLAECDIIFAHNVNDTHFYKGLFPQTKIEVIPSLVILGDWFHIPPIMQENKALIGGIFCRWYGGFQSYVVASSFECPLFVPSMHCKRSGEQAVPNLIHLPYMSWKEWILHIRTYKYAVHLMPTVAAGTFSLNCAIYGIPCIGNMKVDTQSVLYPDCSVDIDDVFEARFLALQLRNSKEFYEHVSHHARKTAYDSVYMNVDKWKMHMAGSLL